MFGTSSDGEQSTEPWEDKSLFCHDLPSDPQPGIGTVLVTGASGYIGGRLVPELLARGYQVRIMVRAESPRYLELWPNAEVVVADALQKESLKDALKGIDTAYYLIHSLLLGPKDFESADIQAAVNFREAAEERQVKRIIYLGGLGDTRTRLSSHLWNRMRVAKELKKGGVPLTILRAAIIIGSGSASYEIIKHLVTKLAVIPIPHWAMNRCQPIGIRDVIKYLVGVLEIDATSGKSFDIGGSDVLTYHMMVKILAGLLNKKRLFIRIPLSNIRFFSYFASFLTPVPTAITRCLMEGLKDEVICRENTIRSSLPFEPFTYREAITRAMITERQGRVRTRWSGAYPPAHELAVKLRELSEVPEYVAHYSIISRKESSALFNSICRIGGKEGWFASNWMWRLRGWVDRVLLGVGTSRGKRNQTDLNVDDVIDFWRIEDIEHNRLLLLRSEMKLPGMAWLEFNIWELRDKRRLSITAYYHTDTLFGKIYWYMFLPFHNFIFNGLIKQIESRS